MLYYAALRYVMLRSIILSYVTLWVVIRLQSVYLDYDKNEYLLLQT